MTVLRRSLRAASGPSDVHFGWRPCRLSMCAPDQLGLAVSPDASAMVTQAVAELRATYQAQSGHNSTCAALIIHTGKLSADGQVNGQMVESAKWLKQAPHSDQAYLI